MNQEVEMLRHPPQAGRKNKGFRPITKKTSKFSKCANLVRLFLQKLQVTTPKLPGNWAPE
jgi:hypothetical protein